MKGTIANFRGGRHTQSSNQMIVVIEGVNSKEDAEKLIGKNVSWKSPADKEIKGSVKAAHGGKGAIRVAFETGMPGQSIATSVEIQ